MHLIAHRGDCHKLPENSLAAIKLAMKGKFQGVEFDVRHSKDGNLYLLHDATLNRTTNMKGRLSDKTSKELRNCRLKNGERLPMLETTLKLLKKYKPLFLEIKDHGNEREILGMLDKHNLKKNTIILSFNHYSLKKIRMLDKKTCLGFSRNFISVKSIKTAHELGCYSLNCSVWTLTKKRVENIHKARFKIFAYYTHSKIAQKRAMQLGVDGIFVNRI